MSVIIADVVLMKYRAGKHFKIFTHPVYKRDGKKWEKYISTFRIFHRPARRPCYD